MLGLDDYYSFGNSKKSLFDIPILGEKRNPPRVRNCKAKYSTILDSLPTEIPAPSEKQNALKSTISNHESIKIDSNLPPLSPKIIAILPEDKSQKPSTTKPSDTNSYDVAKYLVKSGSIFAVLEKQLYYYEKSYGYYRLLSDAEADLCIRQLIFNESIRRNLNKFKLSEITDHLKSYFSLNLQERLSNHRENVNFKNGVLHVPSGKLHKHNNQFGFTDYLDAEYLPNEQLEGENFLNFIETVCGGDKEIERLLQEVLGVIISNVRDLKVSIFFYGLPHTGKSLLLDVVRTIVGEQFCSSISFSDINDRFRGSCLYGKKLNTCGEIGDECINNLRRFKELTGGDTCTIEAKYQNPVSFSNRAILVFAGNSLPRIKSHDTTTAFFERLLIVPFLNSVPKNQHDPNLKQKLLHERDFIADYAIKGLRRLLKNNGTFSECRKSSEIRFDYQTSSNSFLSFIDDQCELTPFSYSFSHEIDSAYLTYCNNLNLSPINSRAMHKILQTTNNLTYQKRSDPNNKLSKRNGYLGIKLINPAQYEITSDIFDQ